MTNIFITLLEIYFGGDPVRRTLFSAETYFGVFLQKSGLFAFAVKVGDIFRRDNFRHKMTKTVKIWAFISAEIYLQ